MSKVIRPAAPVRPMVKSVPPFTIMMAIPAVPFKVPCMMAAAITDRAFRVT